MQFQQAEAARNGQGAAGTRFGAGDPFNVDLKAKRSCGAARATVSIDADGSVYPCHMLHSDSCLMGNAFDEDLPVIMERSRKAVFRQLPAYTEIASCAACEYGPVCGGGCRARALNGGAGPHGADPYCELSKSHYSALFSALSETISET